MDLRGQIPFGSKSKKLGNILGLEKGYMGSWLRILYLKSIIFLMSFERLLSDIAQL
jgi:hypothetical protein